MSRYYPPDYSRREYETLEYFIPIVCCIGGAFFLLNLITYIICRRKSKYYTPKCPLIISFILNFLWCLPAIGIYFFANPGSSSIIYGCTMTIIPCVFIFIVNHLIFNFKLCDSGMRNTLSGLGKIRDRMFKPTCTTDGGMYSAIINTCSHAETKDVESLLTNSPPVIQIEAKKIVKQNECALFVRDYLQYGTWDKVEHEKFENSGLLLIKPKVEFQMNEEMIPMIEQMKEHLCNRVCCDPTDIKVKNVIYGTKGCLVAGRRSRYYRYINSCFGRFIHVISQEL